MLRLIVYMLLAVAAWKAYTAYQEGVQNFV
jgi:hypothetical protein